MKKIIIFTPLENADNFLSLDSYKFSSKGRKNFLTGFILSLFLLSNIGLSLASTKDHGKEVTRPADAGAPQSPVTSEESGRNTHDAQRTTSQESRATSDESEVIGHKSQVTSEEVEGATHDSRLTTHDSQGVHHAETPSVYYLIWAGLAIIGGIVLNEIRVLRNSHDAGHKKHKSNLMPLILVIISFAIFYGEQLPVLFGKVDLQQAKLIFGFHENLFIGFLKLFIKIMLGVLLVSYSILGMEEHH